MEEMLSPGRITVEPEVLATIARFATLETPGVVQIADSEVDRFLGFPTDSVGVLVQDGRVKVDLHIIAGSEVSLLQLGRTVQYEVTRVIQQMIGMPVDAVNVHIEDVVYPSAALGHDRE